MAVDALDIEDRAGEVQEQADVTLEGWLSPIAPHVPTCVPRPAPSLCQLYGSFQALVTAVKRFVAVLREREGRPV